MNGKRSGSDVSPRRASPIGCAVAQSIWSLDEDLIRHLSLTAYASAWLQVKLYFMWCGLRPIRTRI